MSMLHEQFNISNLFIQLNSQTVLFDRQMEPSHVLPLEASVDLGGMAMKGYSAFPKAPP